MFKNAKMPEMPAIPKLPEFKTTKSGYEIRADVLGMAKDLVMEDFRMTFQGWQMSAIKDTNSGQIITKVDMPAFPGLDKILETAEKMYGFVNQSTKK